MCFTQYIAEHGDAECAERWGVKARTVASWRRRERLPRPEQARVIVAETRGQVSMEDIYSLAEQCPSATHDTAEAA